MKIETKSSLAARRLALSSMMCGLSFVFMYLGSATGIFDLCAVVAGSLGTAFLVIEIGGSYPWIAAAVCSVLCVLLLPDKFSAMEYIVLGGVYPILKSFFERLNKIFSWAAKLLFFNAALSVCLALAKLLLNINDEYITFSLVVYGAANIFFVIFDVALTMFISLYVVRLRKKLKMKDIRVKSLKLH